MTVEAYEHLAGHRADDPRRSFILSSMPDDLRDGLLALADRYEEGGERDSDG